MPKPKYGQQKSHEEELQEDRKALSREVRKAASHGDSLCGMLSDLERLADPFYLGLDYADDYSDIEGIMD